MTVCHRYWDLRNRVQGADLFIEGRLPYWNSSSTDSVQLWTKEFDFWARTKAHSLSVFQLSLIINNTWIADAWCEPLEVSEDGREDVVTVRWKLASWLCGEVKEDLARVYWYQLFRNWARTQSSPRSLHILCQPGGKKGGRIRGTEAS